MMPYPATLVLAAALCALLPVSANAQAAPSSLEQLPDTPGSGRYPAVKEQLAQLPDFVVYRPKDLARLGPGKLGLYLFANGGCEADGASARQHLLEIASHGYLAIAPGGIHSGPGATARPPRPKPDLGQGFRPETPMDVLKHALDWALAENRRPGSALYGRIDPAQVAAAGYSCGGLQALQIAADPRIRTVLMMYSGLFPEGSDALGGLGPKKAALARLAVPILYILGGKDDIAYSNGMDDFARIGAVPAAVVNLPVGHGGTFKQAYGGKAAGISVDWLAWQLRGDAAAGRTFRGPQCTLCEDPGVTIERKNIP